MVIQVFQMVGSLGLFLYGMRTMSDGIQKVAGDRLHSVLNFMTGNRFAAIFTGLFVTAIIQSSSATTVMVVSFVNAGLLQLTQAIGVIMGANVGTTVTGWLVASLGFKIEIIVIALPAIGIGFIILLLKKFRYRDFGEVLIGFGLLFMGLEFLKNSVPDIGKYPELLQRVAQFANKGFSSYLLFIGVGMVLTIIVQSSSAAMAITLMMAYSGWIDYPTAATIILGENIGTTITAYIASIGTSVNARRASRAHILFNILGVIWMTPVFMPFLKMVNFITPGNAFSTDITNPNVLPMNLAMFHTLFNVFNTIIFSFFINQIAFVVTKMVPDEKGIPSEYKLKYIRASLQDTPEFYLVTVKRELSKMADVIADMFTRFWDIFSQPEKKLGDEVETQKRMEDLTDQMQEEITKFLSQCSMDTMNRVTARSVYSMMRITNELESIGDSCFNLMLLAERRHRKQIEIDDAAIESLLPYVDLVNQFIRFIRSHLNEHISSENMAVAVNLENNINKMRNTLKESASSRLQEGADVKAELLFIDVVRHVEQIGDHCLNIVESVARLG
ncbi:MAG: Na/Pi cotransporter family protein [Sphaerochaetaceae bacterium]|jgi:phosphate:Na+ symporter|nr:Na/Pi cotransporter family protein [Sphaerochaetaceae bacterium]HHU88278.1 Na/Pi cotransporter family protein [Spirochaetales bacterium]